ncbi:MAG: hypothetical protein JWO31_3938, partial [Phycisphaerales bacterium]|nr:hypothetical protein [Phycisphaerales bacterium]
MEPASVSPASDLAPTFPTLDEWIAGEAIPFSVDSVEPIDAAVGKLVA